MLRFLAIALLGAALGGCVSPEDQRAADQQQCSSYGFRPGSDAFANCMMQQDSRRADAERRDMESYRKADEERARNRQRARDDYIDPRPQYDKDGNPNFDTRGNYIGCRGIGCEVDNPDNGSDDDSDD